MIIRLDLPVRKFTDWLFTMTQTPAITPVDLYDPLMMMPEQRLVDAICALTNEFMSAARSVDADRDDYACRIHAFRLLVDRLGMSDELSWMLSTACDSVHRCIPMNPISFSLLAGDEDASND